MSAGRVKDLKTLVEENRKALTFQDSFNEQNEVVAKV
jgi:hypothetical protein